MSLKIYYAHCIALYGTPQETRDVNTLLALGQVVNPNDVSIQRQCDDIRSSGGDSNDVMTQVFLPLVKAADVVAFRALPDGRIPSGVAKEVEWARMEHKIVIELPSNLSGRFMSIESTREYLSEIGQR